MEGRRIASKAMGFSRRIKWKKKWWCLELHEVLAFQIHIWCKEHYSKKLYQGFLQFVLEYEWKMVVQQRNVSCFFECHQKSYMDELLNLYFVWFNVLQLVLHEVKVSQIHFCIVLISMLDTCLLGCIAVPLPRPIMLMRWGFEYNGCRRPKAENDFAELLPCFFQTSKANHTTINFSHSLLTSKWPLTEATEKMNLAKAGFFIPLTHILFSV